MQLEEKSGSRKMLKFLGVLDIIFGIAGVIFGILMFVGGCGGAQEADDAGRDGDHEHLRDAYHIAVGVGDGDESHHGGCDG